MKKFQVTVNILGIRTCQHVIRAADKVRAEERIQRAYSKHPYEIISLKQLREQSQ